MTRLAPFLLAPLLFAPTGCGGRTYEARPDAPDQAPSLAFHPVTTVRSPGALRWDIGGGGRPHYVDPAESADGVRAESVRLPPPEGHGYTLALYFSEADAAKLRTYASAHPSPVFGLRRSSAPVRGDGSGTVPPRALVKADLSPLASGGRGVTVYTGAKSAEEARGIADELVGR